MGLLNARNLNKAKSLLEKNRHKVGDLVGKATEQIDKASKGKTSSMSAKVEDAARKYSAGGATHTGEHPDAPAQPAPQHHAPVDDAEQRRRESEATIAAANAMKAAAEAAANMMNTAAGADGSSARSAPDPSADPPPADT